jgi:hypothetical protein
MSDTPTDPAPARTAGTGLLDRYRRSRDAEAAYWADALGAPPPKHRSRRFRRTLAAIVVGSELVGAVGLFTGPDIQPRVFAPAFFAGVIAAIMLMTSMRDVLPRPTNGRMGMFSRHAAAPDERLQVAWDRACRQTLTAVQGVVWIGGIGAAVTLYLTGNLSVALTPTLASGVAILAMMLAFVPVAILAWSDRAEPSPDAVAATGATTVPAPPAAGRPYRLVTGVLATGFFFAFVLLMAYTQSRDWTESLILAGGTAVVWGLLTPWLTRKTYARRAARAPRS